MSTAACRRRPTTGRRVRLRMPRPGWRASSRRAPGCGERAGPFGSSNRRRRRLAAGADGDPHRPRGLCQAQPRRYGKRFRRRWQSTWVARIRYPTATCPGGDADENTSRLTYRWGADRHGSPAAEASRPDPGARVRVEPVDADADRGRAWVSRLLQRGGGGRGRQALLRDGRDAARRLARGVRAEDARVGAAPARASAGAGSRSTSAARPTSAICVTSADGVEREIEVDRLPPVCARPTSSSASS